MFSTIVNNLPKVAGYASIVLGCIAIIELFLYLHFKYARSLNKIAFLLLGIPILSGLIYLVVQKLRTPASVIKILENPTLLKVLGYTLIVESIVALLISRFLYKYKTPILLVVPGFLGLCALVLFPLFFQIYLSFVDLNLYTLGKFVAEGKLNFVGISNFVKVFTTSVMYVTPTWWLIIRNFIWSSLNVFFQILFGLILALLLNQKLFMRSVYRTLLIIPWTIPQVISILVWRSEFAPTYGAVNAFLGRIANMIPILQTLGIDSIPWRSHPFWTFLMVLIVNIWLGTPFNMVVILGGMQSISPEFYDSAAIDGASFFQSFRYITLPLLKPVLLPIALLGFIWSFNIVNVVYLMTGTGAGGGSGVEYADLIASALYKAAFTFNRYSLAAALGLFIVVILTGFTFIMLKVTRATD
ncbi:MAG: sugar ABC transporter permease [Actinobacteria bacterium]|nr:sugar ABC transporter permease [Actinomycetota bacterium]